jgi:arylsulfatase A-like enzyme
MCAFGSVAMALLVGCSSCADPQPSDVGAGGQKAWSPETDEFERSLALIDTLPLCDVNHRGLLLDLGTPAMEARFGWRFDPPQGVVSSQHDGSTWSRIYDRTINLSFRLAAAEPVFVSMRAIGKDSRRVSVYLDGFALGTARLGRDKIRIASIRQTRLPLDPGIHQLKLRFHGRRGGDNEPYSEIDWVRVGTQDDVDSTYGAPTLRDIYAPGAVLASKPHRSIGLRAPGGVQCTIKVPPSARLRTAVGMLGSGAAVASVQLHRDGRVPDTLQRLDVLGGDEAKWSNLDLDLSKYAGEVVGIDLATTKTSGTGRLIYGDPSVWVPKVKKSATPKARNVVIVVLNGVARDDLPPWRTGPVPHLPTLQRLANEWTVYNSHRAASTLVSASVATLLSGISPWAHALADAGARLPANNVSLGDLARDGSVRAGLFSGVPYTFEAFGFRSHWESFHKFPPNGGALATEPFSAAGRWLTDAPPTAANRPQVAVVHARGGHPPWDVTPPDAAKLPPDNYTGYLRPRDAAQRLAELRGRLSRLSSADHERLRALFLTALHGQDQALGDLIKTLKSAKRWADTLFVVTGDVASARKSLFRDGLPFDEQLLTIPLYVHFPGGRHAGKLVEHPTELQDVLYSTLEALGVPRPKGIEGRDLVALAGSNDFHTQRIRTAFLDDGYSARWGRYVLLGTRDKRPKLCVLDIDPTCAFDRSGAYPLVTQTLFRRLVRQVRKQPTKSEREPLSLDTETAASLKVWGSN